MKLMAVFFLVLVFVSANALATIAAQPAPSLVPAAIDKLAEAAEGGDEQAFKTLLTEAEKGSVRAELRIGELYEHGWWQGQPPNGSRHAPNFENAMIWYQRAESYNGNAEAQFAIGEMYEQGKGVKKDAAAAAQWYGKARTEAEQGYKEAEYELGWRYELGLPPLKQDLAEALKWLDQSAEQGYPDAETVLGEIYMNGWNGQKQDYKQAIEWFEKAAAQENARAQYDIGTLYEKGLGVAKDSAEADKRHQAALDEGFEPKFITVPQGTITVPQPVGGSKP
jgi:TPR repeat protein